MKRGLKCDRAGFVCARVWLTSAAGVTMVADSHASNGLEVKDMKKLLSIGLVFAVSLVAVLAFAEDAPQVTEKPVDPANAPKPHDGEIILAPSEGEVFTVDEDGTIYQRRGYKGVVPGVRDQADFPSREAAPLDLDAEVPVVVKWVGFQPYDSFSRVFVQVGGEFEYSVTRPAPTIIEVTIPSATPGSENDLNGLITRWFPTSIDRIKVNQMPVADPSVEGGMIVTIHLKKPVDYLYRRDGAYIFVDVGM